MDKRVRSISKGIIPKVNVIVWLEFIYHNATVLNVDRYAMKDSFGDF